MRQIDRSTPLLLGAAAPSEGEALSIAVRVAGVALTLELSGSDAALSALAVLNLQVQNPAQGAWHHTAPIPIDLGEKNGVRQFRRRVAVPHFIDADAREFGLILLFGEKAEDQVIVAGALSGGPATVDGAPALTSAMRVTIDPGLASQAEAAAFASDLMAQTTAAFERELRMSQRQAVFARPVRSAIGDDAGLPMPALQNRMRVASHVAATDPDGAEWRRGGLDKAETAARLYEAVTGRVIDRETRVLDWGVGCGAFARMMLSTGAEVTGIDVDATNIDWCREHLPGRYEQVGFVEEALASRLPAFDLIFSFSVMTHLEPWLQAHWLRQLASVLKPDGIMVISIHGSGYALRSRWDPTRLADFLTRGQISTKVPNTDIADQDPDGHYTDVANTYAFIDDTWSPHVDVLGVTAAFHDYVICRRKAG